MDSLASFELVVIVILTLALVAVVCVAKRMIDDARKPELPHSNAPAGPWLTRPLFPIIRPNRITTSQLLDFYRTVPATYNAAVADGRGADVAWMAESGLLEAARPFLDNGNQAGPSQ